MTANLNTNELLTKWSDLLFKSRAVKLDVADITNEGVHPLILLDNVGQVLLKQGASRESQVFSQISEIASTSPNYGGLGLNTDVQITEDDIHEISFLISAWLEALNSDDRKKSTQASTQKLAPKDRPPMNVTEKIFAMHAIDSKGYVKTGDTIRVSLDWIMASEASWAGMEGTYNRLGSPGIFRNDRFWLAGDHVVDPRIKGMPQVKRLIESSEKARKVFKMTEYQGMNYTIMHTEFFRERAQPGMLLIGSDSHTCSSGAVGCLAIGLGAADVTMGLITGETWFKVPEVVKIEFVGQPSRGIGGKDVILYVLQQLKRNTVASDRVVEYTGPGLSYLSPDARFAISNMTTELGGVTGIFTPDHITKAFIDGRRVARHRNASTYFRADEGAVYAESHVIDLAKVESFVAKYPNPDDVVPVTDVLGMKLDGCFIGACTTAEEDIILGALVLEQGLKSGLSPAKDGKKRKVVPGSLPILDKLRKSGLAQIYEDAGFEIGVPGCSYCVGISADRAKESEVWLSSQNRNFENRMGQGSIGNLASAATVAASSIKGKLSGKEPDWVEPASTVEALPENVLSDSQSATPLTQHDDSKDSAVVAAEVSDQHEKKGEKLTIHGKIQRLGDFVDTDALAPAQFLVSSRTNEEIGAHCLEYTNPEFRARAKEGFDVVVAGKAFGCGSSREQAVSALLGCGIKCVIAESFAFIYGRNQPSLGLLGFTMDDPAFFEAAVDSAEISIDLENNRIHIGETEFSFQLSTMERELVEAGGITPAFKKFGKQLFDMICGSTKDGRRAVEVGGQAAGMQCQSANLALLHIIVNSLLTKHVLMAPERVRVRRHPACRDCRVQKVKCDAEPPASCTRCRHMQLSCVVERTPASRRTKAQLQSELEAMRRRSGADEETDGVLDSPTSGRGMARPSGVDVTAGAPASIPDTAEVPFLTPLLVPALASASAPDAVLASPQPATTPSTVKEGGSHQSLILQNDSNESIANSREFDGQLVSGRKIQDCFDLFFSLYAPFLPTSQLEPNPNQCYEQSPFLFWVIVYIGSRRYTGDPTMLGRLAPKINSMAFASLESRSSPIQAIQGILLLCQWPTPVNTMHRGISLVLAGAALHLAMQIGLHVAGVGQDFARTILDGNRLERANRAMLWKQCCITCYIVGLGEGILPLGLSDAFTLPVLSDGGDGGDDANAQQETKLPLRLCEIMICATEALRRIHGGRDPEKAASLLSCISLFDAQLTKAASQGQTAIDPASRKLEAFIPLFAVACSFINTACQQSWNEGATAKNAPVVVQKSVMLAAFTILKIHRSELAPHLDLQAGEQAYFAAIFFAREESLQNNDLSARAASILGQLWNSQSIFKTKNGTVDSLTSRISSRLSMSTLFDCLWWWRQEFGGLGNPYENRQQTRSETLTGTESVTSYALPATGDVNAVPDIQQSALLADEPFVDFDWAMNLDMTDWPM
ncbi:aconitase family (aconitate hydratase) domain-containing protein [Trichoderma breve]|uniref:Aconitase family (Aconitate hydratase) domain-containing protein n=1 Tax=Trichoderma breve TaxID=2034170 RepID=A0A9W9B7U5_9HYPO|nr:aconitase family (aconitate hydratase) domain-containing protein [Trichoderma breve]KAJ4858218.1 aconitase family (aconitate hydratase) domain-containing protein [Trichoderma breve]